MNVFKFVYNVISFNIMLVILNLFGWIILCFCIRVVNSFGLSCFSLLIVRDICMILVGSELYLVNCYVIYKCVLLF